MESAFWDSSSLVPICVQQNATSVAEALNKRYGMAVWWAAPVEIRGALARLVRMGLLMPNGQVQAQIVMENLRQDWHEILPNPEVRERAERYVDRFPLKAADALQLAASVAWSAGRPRGRVFISGDRQLLEAARELGFKAIEA
jgi:predicted nucleic acid-binding protein